MSSIFVISSIVAVVGAVLMVLRKNPIYGLIFLLVSFSGAAGIFYSLSATFVAVAQILVYAGAIAVLFLFVLMFMDLGKTGEEQLPERVGSLAEYEPAALEQAKIVDRERFRINFSALFVAFSIFGLFVWVALGLPEARFGAFKALRVVGPEGAMQGHRGEGHDIYFGSTESVGQAILRSFDTFGGFALHYEVVGLVVLIGVMGAVILGKRISDEQEEEALARKETQEEAAS